MTQTTDYIAQINTRNYNDQCKYIYIYKKSYYLLSHAILVVLCFLKSYI